MASAPTGLVLSAQDLMPVVRDALARGQHVRFTATGSSMAPFLRHGDVVEVAPLDSAPTVAEVLLVRCPGGLYVLHRVVRVDGRGVYLRGDAQATVTGPFAVDQVLGRAVAAARGEHVWSLRDGPAWHLARLWCATWPLGPSLLAVRRWLCGQRQAPATAAAGRADRAFDQFLALLRTDEAPLPPIAAEDWGRIVRLAQRLGVSPLLARRVRQRDLEPTLPDDVRQSLRDLYYLNAARNTLLLRELAGVLTALSAHEVPVIVLKGAYLAEAVYGDLALRPMADVDLLVPQRAVRRAADVLAGLGYQPTGTASPEFHPRPGAKHLPPLARPGAHAGIELHWSLVDAGDAPAINPREWWQSSTPATVGGAPARALCPEELVLHLSLHLVHCHRFSQDFRALADLAATMVRFADDLDWDRVLALATRRRWRGGVLLALWLAHQWLGAPLPGQVVSEIQRDAAAVARVAEARILLLTEHQVHILRELLPSTWWQGPTGEAPNPRATLAAALRRAPSALWRHAPALLAALGALGPVCEVLRARLTIDRWLADDRLPPRR